MALNSTGESAILEIEVDSLAFEAGMNNVQQKATQSANQINKQYEFMGNSVKSSFKKTEEAGKQAALSWGKIAGVVGVATLASKKYFEWLKTGTTEGSKEIGKLEESWDGLSRTVAGSLADAWEPLTIQLRAVADQARSDTTAITILSGAFGGLIGIIGRLRGQPSAVPTRGELEALLPAGQEIQDVMRRNEAAVWRRISADTAPGPDPRVRQEASFEAAMAGEAETAGPIPGRLTAEESALLRRGRGHTEGGGGGGGGTSFGEAVMREFNARIEAERRYANETLVIRKKLEEETLARVKAAADSEKQIRLAAIDEEIAHRRAYDDALDASAEKDRFYSQQAVDLAQQRMAALDATVQAMQQIQVLLTQGGPAAKTMGRILMAIQAAISAQKAIHEIGEAAAAAARYDAWAAVGHAAAAVSFGIAAGMQLEGAMGGGGGRARSSGGGGGGGGGFASPRGGSMGSEGPQRVEVKVNISAIDLGDRGTLKRIGDVVSAATAAGFVRGRQRG